MDHIKCAVFVRNQAHTLILPLAAPKVWQYGNVSESSISSSQSYSSYTNNAMRSLSIGVYDYTALDAIGFSFSQIRPGKYVTLSGGIKVYVSTQYMWTPQGQETELSVTWLDGLRIYHIIGSLTEAELLRVAEELCHQ